MRIIDARWGRKVNMLVISCECSSTFLHRADRRRVVCRRCRKVEQVEDLRRKYVKENP